MREIWKMPGVEILDSMVLVSLGSTQGCYPWPITPREFLEFAKRDMAGETDCRAAINAFGNAKKAIHAHVDFLLYNLGKRLQHKSFPTKLEWLGKVDIVTPDIVAKCNRFRNLIEHEYIPPSAEQASELIDVVGLYLDATRAHTRPLPTVITFRSSDGKKACTLVLSLMNDGPVLTIDCPGHEPQHSGTWHIETLDEELWQGWVRRIKKELQDHEDPYPRCQ
jgi:hypothetical protein